MNNTQAGVVSGAYFAGYMPAVPPLAALTDRLDARHLYLFACLLVTLGSFGFAFAAGGFVSAALFRACVGAGLAADPAAKAMPPPLSRNDHGNGNGNGKLKTAVPSTAGSIVSLVPMFDAWSNADSRSVLPCRVRLVAGLA